MIKKKLATALLSSLCLTTASINAYADMSISTGKPSISDAVAGIKASSTQEEKVSYILGMNIGSQFKANNVILNREQFDAGIKTAMDGSEPRLTKEEIQQTMQAFQADMQKKQEDAAKTKNTETESAAIKNQTDGARFLAENAKRPGVITTPSGIQYEVLQQGIGQKPKITDTVTVNYTGTLIDGKEFDSSYKRNEPATFAVGAVIAGWVEILQLMPVGSKWKVAIPSELAYGAGGTGGDIGPNATLLFEVELLKIER